MPEENRLRAKLGMNAGAGYGSNDPGDGVYHAAIRAHYRSAPDRLARDRACAEEKGPAHGVDLANEEEIFDFARWVDCRFDKLVLDLPRPQLNTSSLAPRG